MKRLGLVERRKVHCYETVWVPGKTKLLPEHLWKYFSQRYTLFSRYNEGVRLDEAMWYSVTPELIAREQALQAAASGRGRSGVLLDGFCGAGGNSLQFALLASRALSCLVLGLDTEPGRLRLARHNAEVYGAAGRLDFVCADFRSSARLLRPGAACGSFLSPPWADGGRMPHPFEEHFRASQGKVARLPTAVTCYFGNWANLDQGAAAARKRSLEERQEPASKRLHRS